MACGALLMLYMVNYFKWSQKDASTHYKIYTSFVYITPIIVGVTSGGPLSRQ